MKNMLKKILQYYRLSRMHKNVHFFIDEIWVGNI